MLVVIPLVTVAALPLILIPQVPVAPVPPVEGTSRAVRAPEAVVAPVPPLATGRVPETPAVRDTPVQLTKLPEAGVPRTGVTSVGLVLMPPWPEPVEVVTPVPPLATGSVPDTPAVRDTPVQLAKLPEVGVPRIGVTSVGHAACC